MQVAFAATVLAGYTAAYVPSGIAWLAASRRSQQQQSKRQQQRTHLVDRDALRLCGSFTLQVHPEP